MSEERAIYFAGLMEEYLNIPSCVCENIKNELINEKYYKVINYVINRRKELENKVNYKTYNEIINMYLDLQKRIDKAIKCIYYSTKYRNSADIYQFVDIESEILEPLKFILELDEENGNAYLKEFNDWLKEVE